MSSKDNYRSPRSGGDEDGDGRGAERSTESRRERAIQDKLAAQQRGGGDENEDGNDGRAAERSTEARRERAIQEKLAAQQRGGGGVASNDRARGGASPPRGGRGSDASVRSSMRAERFWQKQQQQQQQHTSSVSSASGVSFPAVKEGQITSQIASSSSQDTEIHAEVGMRANPNPNPNGSGKDASSAAAGAAARGGGPSSSAYDVERGVSALSREAATPSWRLMSPAEPSPGAHHSQERAQPSFLRGNNNDRGRAGAGAGASGGDDGGEQPLVVAARVVSERNIEPIQETADAQQDTPVVGVVQDEPVLATATKDTFGGFLKRRRGARWGLLAVLVVVVGLGVGLGVALNRPAPPPPPEPTDSKVVASQFWAELEVPPDLDGTAKRGQFGATVSMSRDGTRMAVGSPDVLETDDAGDGLVRRGLVEVFQLVDKEEGGWEPLGQPIRISARDDPAGLLVPHTETRIELVVAMSSDGKMVAVGSPEHDSSNETNVGQVEVFSLIGDTWNRTGNVLNGNEGGDFFGASVSLSEDGGILAVGAPGNSNNGEDAGTVKVYFLNVGTWDRLGGRDIVGLEPFQLLGGSVSLSFDGKTIAVGSSVTVDTDNRKVASVYRFRGGDWIEVGSGVEGGMGLFDTIYDVALSAEGDRFVISNHYTETQGISILTDVDDNIDLFVQAFQLESDSESGEEWVPLGDNLHAMSPGEKTGYFISLSDDGNVIAMGDPGRRVGDGGNTGHSHIYIYNEDKGNYEQVGPNNNGEDAGDLSGFDVSISGDGKRYVVGAPANRGNGFEFGRVRVYTVPEREDLR